ADRPTRTRLRIRARTASSTSPSSQQTHLSSSDCRRRRDLMRQTVAVLFIGAIGLSAAPEAQVSRFVPVTTEMLENPSPDDWLMYSRTYDAQRFSPLKQISRQNVGQLRVAWMHELGTGTLESIPLVYRGVMYLILPGSGVAAFDATN